MPVVGRFYALLAVMTGWVWFRTRDLDHAVSFFAGLAGLNGRAEMSMSTDAVMHPATVAALAIGAVLATVRVRLSDARIARPAVAAGDTVAIAVIFGLSLLGVAAGSYSPFLYFRF
jgi:hypothetical protein